MHILPHPKIERSQKNFDIWINSKRKLVVCLYLNHPVFDWQSLHLLCLWPSTSADTPTYPSPKSDTARLWVPSGCLPPSFWNLIHTNSPSLSPALTPPTALTARRSQPLALHLYKIDFPRQAQCGLSPCSKDSK